MAASIAISGSFILAESHSIDVLLCLCVDEVSESVDVC